MSLFAGIDLNRLNLDSLPMSELDTIYNAFSTSYERRFGSIDYSRIDTVIKHISSYLKMTLVELRVLYYFEGCEYLSDSDLRMALAVRLLPLDSKHKLIVKVRNILNQHTNITALTALQNQPFRIADVITVWDLIKDAKASLNFANHWEKNTRELVDVVEDQHCSLANQQFDALAKETCIYTTDMALQIIFQIKLLRYLNYCIHKPNYRIIVGRYEDEFGLKAMFKHVAAHLLNNLKELRRRVNHTEYETGARNYISLLFRRRTAPQVYPDRTLRQDFTLS